MFVPLSLCVFGINGIIKYIVPHIISEYLKKNEPKGENIVLFKNYLFLLKQMNAIFILDIIVNLAIMILVFFFFDEQGAFIQYMISYILMNIIINYAIYQRFKVRRLNYKQYLKLYVIGYTEKSIKKYACLEISAFYLTLLLALSIYLFTLVVSFIVHRHLSITYLMLIFIYIVPLAIGYIVTCIQERRNIIKWKKS